MLYEEGKTIEVLSILETLEKHTTITEEELLRIKIYKSYSLGWNQGLHRERAKEGELLA